MSHPTRAVAYYRMSTEKQEASIPAQRTEVEAYAAKHGYQIVREYKDEGISGDATEKRVEFQKMLADAKQLGDFGVVLCWDQDRFGRFDPLEAGYWIKPLRDASVRLETVAQGKIDWEDFAGRIVYAVQQEGKHAYLRDLSRNVVRGMRRSAHEGKWMGGNPPYGYAVVEQRLVPGDPAQVETVRWLFRTYADSETSLRALVHDLNRRGIPAPRGGAWHASPLRNILRCTHYLGVWTWNRDTKSKYNASGGGLRSRAATRLHNPAGEWITSPVTHEPLVDRTTWEKVQRKLDACQKQTAPSMGGGRFLLTGLLVCAHCGSKMHGQTSRNPRDHKEGEHQYLCSGYQGKGRAVCNHHAVRERPLVACLIRKIQEGFLNPENLRRLREEIGRQLETRVRDEPGQAGRLRARLAELDRQIDQGNANLALLPADVIPGVVAKVREWTRQREEVRVRLDALDQRAASARSDSAVIDRAIAQLWALMERLKEADPTRLRAVLREMVSRVECWFDQGDPRKRYRFRFARGLIRLRPDLQLSWLVLPGKPCKTASRTAATVPEW
jgi:site-specific DNA recombinase